MVSSTPTNSTRNNGYKVMCVSELCRICMLPGDYFKNSSHEITIRICKMLKTSTQIDVGINDGYPQIMCNNCYKQLYESYKFALLAKSTQKELRKNSTTKEIKTQKIILDNSHSNLHSKNTLSPIKENIDLNLKSNSNSDIAKIKNSISEKLTTNKRFVLRSKIKKEDIMIVENNNSIDLSNNSVQENLPNLLENEKKIESIEPKSLEPSPTEKKLCRTEQKLSKTKDLEIFVEPIVLKEEEKSPTEKKRRSNDTIETNDQSPATESLPTDKKSYTVENDEIIELKEETPLLKNLRRKKLTNNEVKADPEVEIIPTSTKNEKIKALVEVRRRFSDRVAAKVKENEIKIDLTLLEEAEETPMEIHLEKKALKEETPEKNAPENEKIPERLTKDKDIEKKHKALEKFPKEKEQAKSPKENVLGMTLREKSPEKYPKEKAQGMTLRDKSPEKCPKEKLLEKTSKLSEKLLREKSLKEKTSKMSEKLPKDEEKFRKVPEKPQKSSEKSSRGTTSRIPKEKSKDKFPKLLDDDTIIKKVENDPAVIKFLKQTSKENEKILREHNLENLGQTTSKKLSPTKLLIVKNKRHSKKDEKSKLVQTSIASFYMSPPDKQIKREIIENGAAETQKRSSISILCTRSQLNDRKSQSEILTHKKSPETSKDNSKVQKIDEKLSSNEITLFASNRNSKNISIMSPKLLKNRRKYENENGLNTSKNQNNRNFPGLNSSKGQMDTSVTFLGEYSLLSAVKLEDNSRHLNEPYVLLETLDSNALKRKRDEEVLPQLPKKRKLNIEVKPQSKKMITKKIVVSHKKNSDGKVKKKVKKTFIKINTKYLTRTIKGIKEPKKRNGLRPKEIKIENFEGTKVSRKTETLPPTLDDILNAVGLIRKSNEGGKNKHECKICNLKFCWTESYRRHLASKHKLMPYQCRFCNEKFSSAIKLRRHKKEIHDAQNKPYKCNQCGENFSTFETHLIHVREVHNNKPKIICRICKAEIDDESKLHEHLEWHDKIKKETEMIEKRIKESLPKIIRSENRKFQCEHCSKQFRKSSDLVRHNRVHTGEKPFPCSLCNAKFQQRPNLQKHIISVHAEKKSFTCDICFKSFGRHDSKVRHMLTHAIEKPFTCSECKKSFVRECQLDTHFKRLHPNCKRIHLDETIKAETEI